MSRYTHYSCRITEVIEETDSARSLLLEVPKELHIQPGQFVMVWIPGLSEKNIPLSYVIPSEKKVGITVKKRTPTPAICEICNVCGVCEALFKFKKDDVLRIRGPYGKGFEIQGEKLLLIGYETRMAPLMLLTELACKMNRDVTVVAVAQTRNRLPFTKRFETLEVKYVPIIEEELHKKSSSIEEEIRLLLENDKFDSSYLYMLERTSEKLMKILMQKEIPTQIMVERDIHCGIGICGECAIDPSGMRVCVEGPVFSDRELKDTEFGNYRRHSLKKREIKKDGELE